jgi:anti-sigma B factor antagonist
MNPSKGRKMLNITIDNLGDTTILQCAGRITIGQGDELQTAVLLQVPVQRLVLDLARVSVVDAAGLGLLVSVRTLTRTMSTKLKLMNLTQKVEHVLELTHLKSLFEICSVQEMLELFCRATRKSRLATIAAGQQTPAYSQVSPVFLVL